MWHSTKRCSSIFDLGFLTPKIYSPKLLAITLHYHVAICGRALGSSALPRESWQSTELRGLPLLPWQRTKFGLGAEIWSPTGLLYVCFGREFYHFFISRRCYWLTQLITWHVWRGKLSSMHGTYTLCLVYISASHFVVILLVLSIVEVMLLKPKVMSYGMPLAIWDHTLLPATWHRRTHFALTAVIKLIYLPWRDGRLSRSGLLGSAPTGSQTCNFSVTSPMP